MSMKYLLIGSLLLASPAVLRGDQLYHYLTTAYGQSRAAAILTTVGQSTIPDSSNFDRNLLEKLFILSTHSYNVHAKIFANLTTQAGSAVSKKMLMTPSNNKKAITSRQDIIKLLVSDKSVRAEIQEALNTIAYHERPFMDLWLDPNSNYDEFQSTLLPLSNDSKYHQNSTLLGLSYWHKRLSIVCAPLLWEFGCNCFQGALDETKKTKRVDISSIYQGIKNGAYKHAQDLKQTYTSLLSPARFMASYRTTVQEAGDSKLMGTALFGLRLSRVVSYPNFIYQMSSYKSHNKARLVTILRRDIADIHELIEAVSQLHNLCKEHAELRNMHSFAVAEKILTQDLAEFNRLYQATNAKSIWSYFCENADLVACYTHLESLKYKLVKLYEFIGELDSYAALAKLLSDHAGSKLEPYCCAQLIETEAPVITLTGFWNILVSNNKAINSLTIGSPNKHLLLEGPHACGKSTITRAIAYNFVLLHCFGIAAALQAECTLFDRFISYANIRENPALNLSGFDAQLHEITQLRETIKSYDKRGQKLFCFLDEPLTGTMEEAGAQELRDFCDFIATQRSTVCVLATHFNNVTKPESFKPFFVSCDETKKVGDFVREYLLKQGKHPWWYEDAEKRTRYINWMRKNARAQLGLI